MEGITWTQNRVSYAKRRALPCPAHLLAGSLPPRLASPWMGILELEQLREEPVEELTAPHRAAFTAQLWASVAV